MDEDDSRVICLRCGELAARWGLLRDRGAWLVLAECMGDEDERKMVKALKDVLVYLAVVTLLIVVGSHAIA